MRVWTCRTLIVTMAVALFAASRGPGRAAAQADAGWDELVSLNAELNERCAARSVMDRRPQLGTPRQSPHGRQPITDVQTRLPGIDASDWSVAGKVDYLLVWAKANGMEFEHRVTRPWQKDPILYLDQIRRVPYIDLPLCGSGGRPVAGVVGRRARPFSGRPRPT